MVDAEAVELLADADAEHAAMAEASIDDDEALLDDLVHMSPVMVMAVPDWVAVFGAVSLAMANCAVMTRAMTAIPAANFFMVVFPVGPARGAPDAKVVSRLPQTATVR